MQVLEQAIYTLIHLDRKMKVFAETAAHLWQHKERRHLIFLKIIITGFTQPLQIINTFF